MSISVTVIVGAGHAGSELAWSLRQQGYSGRIVLVGAEPTLPYRRPPLSKACLLGTAPLETLLLRAQAAYDKQAIECRHDMGVESIDRAGHSVLLDDGTRLSYDKLALTTGCRARRLTLPGADKPNVHYLRTVADAERLCDELLPGKRLVIIGGGYVGLEVAAVACQKDLHVTVVEALPRVLARVTAPEISSFYERIHRERGVELRTNVGVRAMLGEAEVQSLVLTDGTQLSADLVVVGVGAIANTDLAETAGLEVANGIVVDRFAVTSDPDIVAAGDCTFHENTFLQRRVRLESVANAVEQSRIAAASILGQRRAYSAVPWFWSDQYDLKLQMVGLSEGYDHLVIRGDLTTNSFSGFYLKAGILICVDCINRPQDFMVAKKLVGEQVLADPGALQDPAVPLKSLLRCAA